MRKFWKIFGGVILITLLAFAALIIYMGTHLVVTQAPEKADLIVLLGGGGPDRAETAARLYREGWAPLVLMSGYPSECNYYAQVLIENGVSAKDIIFDDKATTTQTNGLNSSQIIKSRGLHKILLVTSWFHSSRSYRIFHKYLPDVDIISVPTEEPKPWTREEYNRARTEILSGLRNWYLHGIPLLK